MYYPYLLSLDLSIFTNQYYKLDLYFYIIQSIDLISQHMPNVYKQPVQPQVAGFSNMELGHAEWRHQDQVPAPPRHAEWKMVCSYSLK